MPCVKEFDNEHPHSAQAVKTPGTSASGSKALASSRRLRLPRPYAAYRCYVRTPPDHPCERALPPQPLAASAGPQTKASNSMGGPTANTTDVTSENVHGTNPQRIVEKILRTKVYATQYWKESCFGLTAETLVDRAIELSHVGGTYGGTRKPTKFMCLLLKMLQIQPDLEIVVEFVTNEDYKYVRALGALYLRCVGRPADIYRYLEPLYTDYSKLRVRTFEGWHITHLDQFIDENFNFDEGKDNSFDIISSCIDMVFSEEEAWEAKDCTKKELLEFVERLNSAQFKEVEKFFDTMPKLSHEIEIENPNTKVKSTVTLEGLASFFG